MQYSNFHQFKHITLCIGACVLSAYGSISVSHAQIASKFRLANLAGQEWVDLPNVESDSPQAASNKGEEGMGIPEFVALSIQQSPQIRQAFSQLESAEAREGVARADLLPSASLRIAKGPEKSESTSITTDTGKHTYYNYTFNDGAGTTVNFALKPYSGANVASLSTSGNTAVGTYDVKDTAYTQTGTNFNGTPVFIGALTVDQKALTPSATGASKVYDGTTSMNNVVLDMTGKVSDDVVTLIGTGAFNQKNVGTNLGYSLTNIALASSDASNYYLGGGVNSVVGNDGVITPKIITLTGTTVANKVYDGNTNATITAEGNLIGLVGNETLSLIGLTGTYSSIQLGIHKAVALSATL